MTPLYHILLACFAPSLFWLAYWYYRSHLGTRRLPPILAFFLTGLLAGPLALFLFDLVELSPFYERLGRIHTAGELEKFAYALFAIGPIEEMAKFLVAWACLRLLDREVDQLFGGPVFAAAAALGFATIENIYYMIDIEEVVWHRALTLPFNHVLFSSFWGVGLSLYKLRPRNAGLWLGTSLVLSSVYHGLYDYILLSDDVPAIWVMPLMLVLWLWLVAAIPRLRQGIREARERGNI